MHFRVRGEFTVTTKLTFDPTSKVKPSALARGVCVSDIGSSSSSSSSKNSAVVVVVIVLVVFVSLWLEVCVLEVYC